MLHIPTDVVTYFSANVSWYAWYVGRVEEDGVIVIFRRFDFGQQFVEKIKKIAEKLEEE